MKYTTILAPDALRALGLPHAVAEMDGRKIVGAFLSEEEAIDFFKKLNHIEAKTKMLEPEPKKPEPIIFPK